jgi:hypothetical protein
MKAYIAILMFVFLSSSLAVFGAVPSLNGEWEATCHKKREFFFEDKVAFIGDTMVHQWKWYKDENCKELLGEYWDTWNYKTVGPSTLAENAYNVDFVLIDGYEKTLRKYFDVVVVRDGQLVMGDEDAIWDAPNKRVNKLSDIIYNFRGNFEEPVSIEKYTSGLNREF